jgi:Tfp pilus assembly protein PilO
MLHELELFGKKNNLLILSVRPVFAEKNDKKDGDSEKKSAYEEQNIVVKGRGTYGGVLQFVDALKNFPKIVAVRSFTMVPRDTATINSGSPLLEFELALQAYAFKDSPKGQEDDGKVASRTIGVRHES